MKINDTIVALATASGAGAIAIIRVSGKDAIEIVNPLFSAKSGKQLKDVNSHTIHLGDVKDTQKLLMRPWFLSLKEPNLILENLLLKFLVTVVIIFNRKLFNCY